MPTLYTMPGTCALAPNIAATWIDAAVTIHNLERGEQRGDAYLKLNPHGKVPALRFDDGDVLTEAAAIMAFLGAEYGGKAYARDTKLGRREAGALSYMTSEVHADYGPHFAEQRFAEEEACQEAVKAMTYEKLTDHYRFLETELGDDDWYLGERSFADAYLYVLTRWIELTPLSLNDYPGLKGHRDRMEADAGVHQALARQGMEPVG